MINKTTRVVVVDDEPGEVDKLMNYLNMEGIPTNYFDSDPKKLPPYPLKGVRMLFLDLVLVKGQTDEKNVYSTIMGILPKIIAKENGPYILVMWTRHKELVNSIKDKLFLDPSFAKPIAVLDMVKIECMNDLSLIERKIKQMIKNDDVTKLLLDWEAAVHEASYEVLDLLHQKTTSVISATNFDEYSKKSRTELERFFCSLAKAELGGNLNNSGYVLVHAQTPLTDILHDKLETKIKKSRINKELTEKILSHKTETPTSFRPSELNTMFLIEEIYGDKDRVLCPGNIYTYASIRRLSSKKHKVIPPLGQSGENSEIIRILVEGNSEAKGNCQRNHKRINKETIPILIEITPPCVYAQMKSSAARFLFGMLLPPKCIGNDSKLTPNKETFYPRPPLTINYKGVEYYLILTDRIYGIDSKFLKKLPPPIMRARRELLVDILNWIGRDLSRPGRIQFD